LDGLGNNKKEWDNISKVIIEPRGKDGEITFYLDNIYLHGKSGKKDLLDPANLPRPYTDIPKVHKPLNKISHAGFAFVAGNMGFWENEKNPTNAEEFCRFSSSLAVSAYGFDGYEKAGKLSEKMYKLGRPLLVEHPNAKGFAVELTEAQAWCVRWDGESNNLTPGKFNIVHTGCVCNPAFLEMNKRRADAILASGINTFCVVDYVWPYCSGRWGYSKADIEAYRKALNGTDGGLKLVEGDKTRDITFWDYFEDHSGFTFKPEDLGYKSWDEYTPTTEDEAWADDGPKRRNMYLFVTLNHYEWLKFLQNVGLYMESKGGNLWIIPNPEDIGTCVDFIYAGRIAGLQCNFPEYFGNPMWADALYRSGGYLARNYHEAGHFIGPCFETNAGGHGRPYYDVQVSYAAAYGLCASMQADVIKNDFLDEAPISVISNPKNASEFDRFRDTMSKVYAFDQYKLDKPKRLETKVAVVASRNVNRYCSSIFFTLNATRSIWDGSPAMALAAEGMAFDLMNIIRYSPIEEYSAIFWGLADVPPASVERIKNWLANPANVLVCHSSQPTRRNKGLTYNPYKIHDQRSIGDPDGGKPWGLPKISLIKSPENSIIDKVAKPFDKVFTVGEMIELPEDLYEAKGGKVLLSASGKPLVSEFRVPLGGRVIYLHYRSGEPDTLALDRKIAATLAEYLGTKRLADSVDDVLIHSYGLDDGGAVHVLWSRKALADWDFVYDMDSKQRLTYANPGFTASIKVPVPKPAKYIVYDILADNVYKADAVDSLELKLTGVTCGICYLLPDDESGQSKLEQLRANPIHRLFRQ